MTQLPLAHDFALPLEAATRRMAILAMSGAGKSNLAVVMAERMFEAGIPWVAIDPKGDWYGVRSDGDGQHAGLAVPVFGGLHGDVPLEPTAGKLMGEIIEPLLIQLANQSDPKLLDLLKKPLSEILVDLDAEDKHIAGLALEALGFKLMRLVDMEYVATRLRGSATGGAEVDIIFHSSRLVYSRWQVQCKNTARVSLDDVAKEVGLTHFLKSTVIVIVTTGEIGGEARRYANKIMADSNLAIVMLNGADLKTITATPASIVSIFEREARHAMKLKSFDLKDSRS